MANRAFSLLVCGSVGALTESSTDTSYDGRPLAHSICISIACAFAVFLFFLRNSVERKTISRSREFAENPECVKQVDAKDLDPVWNTFTDTHLEDRFQRMTMESTFSRLQLPMACVCLYVISEVMLDSNWNFSPCIHRWNNDAAVVLNVCAIAVVASCYYTHRHFARAALMQLRNEHDATVANSEQVLEAATSWVVSLVLFFGTRHRVSSLFYGSERGVFASSYGAQERANDEISIVHTLVFTLVVFAMYVPLRFYYLLHLSIILGLLYPFSLCLRPTLVRDGRERICASSMTHVCAFYVIVAVILYGHRAMEVQRRRTFKALFQRVDAQMEQTKTEQVGTALERLLTNLRTVDKSLENGARDNAWATTSRAHIKESLEILSHTDGLFSLNVDTMFKNNAKIASLDGSVDFKRYLKIEFGQAGGRKMFDGVMSERKADTLLSTWGKRANPRRSMRRDTQWNCRNANSPSPPCTPHARDRRIVTPKTGIKKIKGDIVQTPQVSVDVSGVGSDWNFDTLSLSARTGNRALLFVAEELVVPLSEQVFSCVESKELMRLFIRRLWSHYLPQNPYHNEAHGATVCHMAQYLFNCSGDLKEHSTSPELMGLLIAALGHDCGHFGRNNLFCENSGHRVAFMYNDAAVLESMHAAVTMRLLAAGNVDYMSLLESLSLEQRRAFKNTVISFIIATDMKKHFETISKFRSKVASVDWCLKQPANRISLGKLIMKASDVGQAAVKWDLHMEWSLRVLAEFFEQGDDEVALQLPVSPLCDRGTYDLCTSQKFFTDVLCRPLFEEIRSVVGNSNQATLESLLHQMSTNNESWKSWMITHPWDPTLHHWPPAKWWPDWKKHTPTGKILSNGGDCNTQAVPYAFNQPLSPVTSVNAHLDLIARPFDDPEDFIQGNTPRSSQTQLRCGIPPYSRNSSKEYDSDLKRLTVSSEIDPQNFEHVKESVSRETSRPDTPSDE